MDSVWAFKDTATICDATSSIVLGRLVQCEQKGWDRGRCMGLYIHPKVKTAWLCVGLTVKSLSRVIAQMVLENSHLTSQGLHEVRFL